MVCILAGGLKTIPSGLVATLELRILPAAEFGTASVHTGQGLAVLPGLQSDPIPAAEGAVTIRAGSDKSPPKRKG